jgi:hypothetical protein
LPCPVILQALRRSKDAAKACGPSSFEALPIKSEQDGGAGPQASRGAISKAWEGDMAMASLGIAKICRRTALILPLALNLIQSYRVGENMKCGIS